MAEQTTHKTMITELVILALLAGCVLGNTTPIYTPTGTNTQPTITETYTPSPTATLEVTVASTLVPSPTPVPYQILGRIFAEGNDSAGVSCNINTGSLDSKNTHYDVAIPRECRAKPNNCPVFSPVDGSVWEIYGLGNPKGSGGGYVISINLSQPPEGIENVLTQLNINPTTVYGYSIHLGHLVGINTDLEAGTTIAKGMLLADGVYNTNMPEPKVAYVLYIKYYNALVQVSPCSVVNISSGFCGICFQYDGPCPETDMNFPVGGIEWWYENDPFWDTHKLSPP